jgi:MFS family permease
MGRRYNWLCAAVAGSGSMLYGYDSAIIASTYASPNSLPCRTLVNESFAQPGFLARFQPSATVLGYLPLIPFSLPLHGPTNNSAIASTYFAGVLLGVVFCHLFADSIGRKRSIQVGGVIGLVGAIIQTCSYNIATFFVGRVFAGVASGIMLPVVNVYQAEIAPPHLRGAMVCLQLVLLASAGTLASWVGFACYHAANVEFQWYPPFSLYPLVTGVSGAI